MTATTADRHRDGRAPCDNCRVSSQSCAEWEALGAGSCCPNCRHKRVGIDHATGGIVTLDEDS
jgi:hypothetical protein